MTLTANGLLSGTPVATGDFSFVVAFTDADSCRGIQTYTLVIAPPPTIAKVKKLSDPFRLVVSGSNLQNGIQVYIGTDTTPWPNVVWKNTGKIQITGGTSLKTKVPKGVIARFRFVNPDGGEATETWSY